MPAPNDSGRINLRQRYEVEYWTKELDLTDSQLADIIKVEVEYWTKELDLTDSQLADIIEIVGDSVDAVRARVGR